MLYVAICHSTKHGFIALELRKRLSFVLSSASVAMFLSLAFFVRKLSALPSSSSRSVEDLPLHLNFNTDALHWKHATR